MCTMWHRELIFTDALFRTGHPPVASVQNRSSLATRYQRIEIAGIRVQP